MDENTKKLVLRMIPYGLYVLTAENENKQVAASTVNWVTQTSFNPPMVVVAVKADSSTHDVIMESQSFALNMLSKDQQALAFNFFKHHDRQGQQVGGESFQSGSTGAPLLDNAPAFIECVVEGALEGGDHTIVAGKVVDVGIRNFPDGRPDEAILWLKDLGDNIFYGG
jgi:flavin reductase (DIM6/NTAB) family NADH-FMN oxidoreductase RutF